MKGGGGGGSRALVYLDEAASDALVMQGEGSWPRVDVWQLDHRVARAQPAGVPRETDANLMRLGTEGGGGGGIVEGCFRGKSVDQKRTYANLMR